MIKFCLILTLYIIGQNRNHEVIFLLYASTKVGATKKKISILKKFVSVLAGELLTTNKNTVGVVTLNGHKVSGFVTNKKSKVQDTINKLK